MLDVLRDTPARRRIAVLGEMRELGDFSEHLHEEVGAYAAACSIDVLIAMGGAARPMLGPFASYHADLLGQVPDLPVNQEHYFDQPEPAGRFVRQIAQPGDAILFKGSRGVRVEKALEEFLNPRKPALPDVERGRG
jgi:UDP-N-acetylmuramoyl-tripeptide--D-alanyl-D-alanine ligase